MKNLNETQMKDINGGWIPIILWAGVSISAECVTGLFCAGVAVGAAAAAGGGNP